MMTTVWKSSVTYSERRGEGTLGRGHGSGGGSSNNSSSSSRPTFRRLAIILV